MCDRLKKFAKKFIFGLYALSLVLAYIIFFNTFYFVTNFLGVGNRTYESPDKQTAAALGEPLIAYYERTGILPQWSPYIFCGMPALGSLMYSPDIKYSNHIIDIFLRNPVGLVMLAMLVVYFRAWNKLKVDVTPGKSWLSRNCMRVWVLSVSLLLCLIVHLIYGETVPFRFVQRSIIWFAAVAFLTIFMSDVKSWSNKKSLVVASLNVIWIFFI